MPHETHAQKKNKCYIDINKRVFFELKDTIMSTDRPLNFLLPEDFARQLGVLARERRLASNLSRETLAGRSGVPAPTLRKFETTGAISLIGLLRLADGLDCLDDFKALFPRKPVMTMEEFVAPTRQRGRK